MPQDPRTPFDTWRSRGPSTPLAPTVRFHTDPEADYYAAHLGDWTGPPRATQHAAEADADLLAGAVGPSLAAASRASALRSDPLLLDRVIGARPLGSRTVAAREQGEEGAPTLDRVTTGGAVVADGSGE